MLKIVLSFLVKITRPLRWGLIKVLSPGLWDARAHIPSASAMPRGSTLYAIEHFGDRPISYCEVGVNTGLNVLDVNERLNVKQSFLVDMYEAYETVYEGRLLHFPQDVQDEAYESAVKLLKPYADKITWILKYSNEAIKDLDDGIDFIYIDGNHEYEYVKSDIENYWAKLAKNGILAGHDFLGSYNGLIRAVFEFATKNKLRLYSNRYDWWFIKPEDFDQRTLRY